MVRGRVVLGERLPAHVPPRALHPGRGGGRAGLEARPGTGRGGPRPLLRSRSPRRAPRRARLPGDRGRPLALPPRPGPRAAAAGAQIEFVQEDMRRFVRADAFDLALNLFTSFGYFASRDDDLTVLRGVHASLRAGGLLVMDLMGKEPLARHFEPTRSQVLDDGTLLVERTQVLADWARVRADWVASRHGRARTLTFTCTLYSGQELRALLREAGFGEVRLHGSLDGRPYDLDAQRLVAVARKTVD